MRFGEFERCLLNSVSVAIIAAVAPPSGTSQLVSTQRRLFGPSQSPFWSFAMFFSKCSPTLFSRSSHGSAGCTEVSDFPALPSELPLQSLSLSDAAVASCSRGPAQQFVLSTAVPSKLKQNPIIVQHRVTQSPR